MTVNETKYKQGKLAKILISHPEHRNALSGRMMVDFARAVGELEGREDVAAVVLTGDENFFCSGSDLSLISNLASKADGQLMCEFMTDVTTRLSRLPAVSCSVVKGGAYGGGSELTTSTDHRVFHTNAVFRMVHTQMALSTGWGGAARLSRIVPRSDAIQILCGAKPLRGPELLKYGIADRVSDDVDAAVEELLDPYLKADCGAVRSCKRAIIATEMTNGPSEAIKMEMEAFVRVWGAEANLKAIEAAVAVKQRKM